MIHLLEKYYFESPAKPAYISYDPQKVYERRLSYWQLAAFSEQLGLQLLDNGFSGKTCILVYNNVLHFVITFFACQYAGIIPIPALFSNSKRQVDKIMQIQNDSGAEVILSDETLRNIAERQFGSLVRNGKCRFHFIRTDWKEKKTPQFNKICTNPIAFIQYTSGSTSAPKGVIISQANLRHNQKIIKDVFHTDSASVLFSWLPFQHDMGLVGNILHNIFIGGTCVVMSPFSFMQHPKNWLQGISKYRVTHSGAPNFAFDYCVARIKQEELKGLNLSSWKVAFNGSEPVRYETIKKFAEYFEPTGFDSAAMHPCYGLAEATLIVSGGKKPTTPQAIDWVSKGVSGSELNLIFGNRKIVCCGQVPDGVNVIIWRDHKICGESEEGEILVAGESVTSGYWNRSDADMFKFWEDKRYLKTGDWGFLKNGALFICGRLKEMLVARGVNIYPYEIEQRLSEMETSCEENGIAIFQTDAGVGDEVVVVAEIKRSFRKSIHLDSVVSSLDKSACELLGIAPYDVVLVQSLGIPRTTSGKIKRLETGKMYREGTLASLISKRTLTPSNHYVSRPGLPDLGMEDGHYIQDANLQKYLVGLIAEKTNGLLINESDFDKSLFSIGVDSLRLTEIINSINNDLQIQLDIESVMQDNALNDVMKTIQNMVWLKTKPVVGDRIVV